jgi:hypothetical protein
MNKKWHSIAWLSLLMLLAVAAGGRTQEPARQSQPPATVPRGNPPSMDAKSAGDRKAAAAFLEGAYQDGRTPESVRMLAALLRGGRMGPGEGWFGPAETRYSWAWLARRCDVHPAKGGIPRKSFPGSDALFARLDRDKNGTITSSDLDWSDNNPYLQAAGMADRLFRQMNLKENGKLTKAELLQFFESAALEKDHVDADDFRDALLAGMFGRSGPGNGPTPDMLVRGLFSGELGSMNEGPKVNDPAPDFTLKTADGKSTVHLAKLIGPKPVVLVFGSFT